MQILKTEACSVAIKQAIQQMNQEGNVEKIFTIPGTRISLVIVKGDTPQAEEKKKQAGSVLLTEIVDEEQYLICRM